MKSKIKTIRISKSSVLLSLYVFSIIFVVGLFALQSGKVSSAIQPSVLANDNAVLQTSFFLGSSSGKNNPSVEGSGNGYEVLPIEPVYSYEIVSKSNNPKVYLGGKAALTLKIKNTGNTVWFSSGKDILVLGASHPFDRETIFYREGRKGWYSGNRIKMDGNVVKPGKVATFIFEINAPETSGIYREFFTPLVEDFSWLDDKEIYWDIEVREPEKKDEELKITVNGGPVKYIKIKLSEQMLYAYENGISKYKFQTSTGKNGMNTPTGEFQIYNKFPVQYSAPYELYMDNWMAFTANGAYGIHSLPYWPLKNGGRLYEGEEHLGTKVSHGCVRLSLENSITLYDWAEVGTAVYIEE